MDSDTSLSVWSMHGDKLANISTYQIEHYDVKYTNSLVLVRGWTSEVKAFQLVNEKDGSFNKIDKGFHLALNEKPRASVIDAFGLHACAITGEDEMIKLWKLGDPSHPVEVTVDSYQVNIEQPKHCSIATLKLENERMKTVVLLASSTKMVLVDRNLKLIKEF